MDLILIKFGADGEAVKGTSQIAEYLNQVECLSYNHGISLQVTGDISNTERTSGRSSHQDFHFSKYLDGSSPSLNQKCCEGAHVDEVTITIGRNDAGAVVPLMVYTLGDVLVSSVSVGGGGGDKPVESLSLNYATIKWEMTVQNQEGGEMGTATGSWDLTTNTPMEGVEAADIAA